MTAIILVPNKGICVALVQWTERSPLQKMHSLNIRPWNCKGPSTLQTAAMEINFRSIMLKSGLCKGVPLPGDITSGRLSYVVLPDMFCWKAGADTF